MFTLRCTLAMTFGSRFDKYLSNTDIPEATRAPVNVSYGSLLSAAPLPTATAPAPSPPSAATSETTGDAGNGEVRLWISWRHGWRSSCAPVTICRSNYSSRTGSCSRPAATICALAASDLAAGTICVLMGQCRWIFVVQYSDLCVILTYSAPLTSVTLR